LTGDALRHSEIDITNSGWVSDYVADFTPLVEVHGGRYFAWTPRIEVPRPRGAQPRIDVRVVLVAAEDVNGVPHVP